MLATRNKILDMESKRDLALKIIKINNEIANDELVVYRSFCESLSNSLFMPRFYSHFSDVQVCIVN